MSHFYNEAEKFINDIFWNETHDKNSRLNIPEVIDARLLKDNQDKDPEYYNHRQGVIHVSSLGKCLRGVVHEMLGTEKDAPMDARKLGVFKAGNLFEDYIVEALGEFMLDRQTEYVYDLGNGVVITGRDDGTIEYEGQRRMLECKSVHSDSFWHRQKEGTLVAYQNQMQIQTYLWLRRIMPNVFVTYEHTEAQFDEMGEVPPPIKEIIYTNMTKQSLWEYRGMRPDDKLIPIEKPDNSDLNGSFAYISKDDCTTIQAPVKFNMRIIEEVVKPAIETVVGAYLAKNPEMSPLPPLTLYDKSRGQYKKNWLCTYCEYHCKCAGAGWVLEAQAEVTRLNKEGTLANPHAVKKTAAPIFSIPPSMKERIKENAILADAEMGTHTPFLGVDTGGSNGDAPTMVKGTVLQNGDVIIDSVEFQGTSVYVPPQPNGEGDPWANTPEKEETTLERMVRESKEKSGL